MARRKKGSKLAKVMQVPQLHGKKKYFKKYERFEPTRADVDHWFFILNRDVFENQLRPFHKIDIRRRHVVWGECDGKYDGDHRYCNLSLHHYFASLQHFIEVLAHEMVHAMEWQESERMTHGEVSFYVWAPKLAKFNIKLEE